MTTTTLTMSLRSPFCAVKYESRKKRNIAAVSVVPGSYGIFPISSDRSCVLENWLSLMRVAGVVEKVTTPNRIFPELISNMFIKFCANWSDLLKSVFGTLPDESITMATSAEFRQSRGSEMRPVEEILTCVNGRCFQKRLVRYTS